MDGTATSRVNLAKLWEDHHAMAEAVHGLLGRVELLESRVDYLEHGRRDARTLIDKTHGTGSDLPRAIHTGLTYVGRAVFMIDGESGLWGGKRDRDDDSPRSLLVAMPPKRGSVRSRYLYRQDTLSASVAAMFENRAYSGAEETKP